MPRCRFFEGFHDYAQDECDRVFCRSVLDGVRARLIPLPLIPDPRLCDHKWEVYFARMRVPWASREKPGWSDDVDRNIVHGLMMMSDHTFSVCEECGTVSYSHRELGGPILCLPDGRGSLG